MKKFFLMIMMALLCNATIYAQTVGDDSETKTPKELAKERRAVRKLAIKEMNAKAVSDAKKQAKKLKKQGWMAAPGTEPIEKQLTNVYVKRYTYEGNFPKFFIGMGTASSTSAGMARKQAVTRARVDVAGSIQAEVVELTEDTSTNTELSKSDVETIAKTVSTSQTLVQQSIGRTEVVMDIIRDKGGKYEESVAISYDGSQAKAVLMKAFENDSAEIKAKMQDLINK